MAFPKSPLDYDLEVGTRSYSRNSSRKWLQSAHGVDAARTVTIDGTAFAAEDLREGYLAGGTALAEITASGLYGPYDAAATDGREVLAGFLLNDMPKPAEANAAAMLTHGRVSVVYLPFPVDAAGQADVKHIEFV